MNRVLEDGCDGCGHSAVYCDAVYHFTAHHGTPKPWSPGCCVDCSHRREHDDRFKR